MIPNEVTILCWSKPDSGDLNFLKVAEFLGLRATLLTLNRESASLDYLEKNLPPHPVCLVTSGSAIAQLCSSTGFDRELKTFLLRRIAYLLIYTLQPDPRQAAALDFLSGGAIFSISPVAGTDAGYQISPNQRDICRQLTGLSCAPFNSKTDLTLSTDHDTNGLESLITIGTGIFFAALKCNECSLFVIACNTLVDIDQSVSPAADVSDYFSQVIPVMMFLKHVFKDRVWHAQQSYANFTIDDPLLQRRYGFLDYRKLLQAMDYARFSTTIAFIPWNFKRTDSAIAALFKSRPDKFSLVVHGSDHTGGEYNSDDVSMLSRKTSEALRRMQCHQKSTGLPFDRVMIFPQGIFSTTSMGALKANNFIAAVNSTARPAGGPEISLRLRDLLDVAILNYCSFPLFVRRYPVSLFGCALDLFLEKPLLLVEHHGYFRHGYDQIAEFVTRVNALDENLAWQGLGHVLQHSNLRRTGPGTDLHMKLYAHRACLANQLDRTATYHISKADSRNLPVSAVTLSGLPVYFAFEGDTLTLSVQLAGGSRECLEVRFENPWRNQETAGGLAERLKVFARRRLSEFRDNYIAMNPSLLHFAYRIKALVGRTQSIERPHQSI